MPVTGTDTANASYAAGKARANAERTKLWAGALSHGVSFAANITKQSLELAESIDKAAEGKIREGLDKDLYGYNKGDVSSPGRYRNALTLPNDTSGEVPNPDSVMQAFDDVHEIVFNADYIAENYGVTRRQAERFLERYQDEYDRDFQNVRTAGVMQSQRAYVGVELQSKLNTLVSDPDLSEEQIYEQYESFRNSFPATAFNYDKEFSLDDPEFRAAALSTKSLTDLDRMYADALKNPGLNKAQLADQVMARYDEYMGDTSQLSTQEQSNLINARRTLEGNVRKYIDGLEEKSVWGADSKLAAGVKFIAAQQAQDPTWTMDQEQFDAFIRNQLGMDPDNNYLDKENATALYESVMKGNTEAANAMVKEYISDPENYAVFENAMQEQYTRISEGSTVNRRTYTITGNNVTMQNGEGEVVSKTYMPTYEETEYRSSSAALNDVFTAYERRKNITEGAETTISTDYGDIVDMLPASIKNDKEAFIAAVEYINSYGSSQATGYSDFMKNKALGVATDISLTQVEKRDSLAKMLSSNQISMEAYNEAIAKVNFAFEDDRVAIENLLKTSLYTRTGSNDIYNQLTSDPDFQNRLEKWILGWRTIGGTLQSANPQQFIDQQIGIFMADGILDEQSDATVKALGEIFDTSILVGNNYAFSVSNPMKLKEMADKGDLAFILNQGAVATMRQQIGLADSGLTTSMKDIQDTGARYMYGSDYEDLSDFQKDMVDVNATLAVIDQFDFEMLKDTFIEGQGLDSFTEIRIKDGSATRVGLLGSDGFVYFLPNYSYDENQAASYFYLGTDSDIYRQAMSGGDVSINLAGYSLGVYRRPASTTNLNEMQKTVDVTNPPSLSDVKDPWVMPTPQEVEEMQKTVDISNPPDLSEVNTDWVPYTQNKQYIITDDPQFTVGKKTVMGYQRRKDNA